ncbi:MAG: hypothetical protein KW806_00880 [Candidatus Yanofskybacteria bacterium]|nr:hypothetical protein [Candidatus Yanofskybacteria bacterium]
MSKFLSELKVFFAKPVALVLSALLLGSSATAYYFYDQYAQAKTSPQEVAQKESDGLIAAVSKLMVLPENESPTIATVADPLKLINQPFFARAKKGDKVLIYTNARKAILFDPIANKILEVAPLNIGENNPAPAPTPSPTPKR